MAITKIKINNPAGQEPSVQDIGAEGTNVTFSNTGTSLQSTNADAAIKEVLGKIPTNTNQLTNGAGYITISSVSTVGQTGNYSDLNGAPVLADVATSGDYEDLDNTPTDLGDFTNNEGYIKSNYIEANPAGTASGSLTSLKVDNTIYSISGGGGGGDSVSWNQVVQSGTKIAEVTINSTTTDVYAPSGGGRASVLEDLTDVVITSVQNNQDLSYDTTSSKWINKTKQVSLTKAQYDALPSSKLTDGIQYFITDLNVDTYWIDLTGTLTAGQTSITLSDSIITTDSTFDFYTDTFGANPTNVVATNGSITLTFEAQQSDVGVKVRVTTDGTPSGSGNGNGNVTINSSTIVDVSQVI